MNPRVDLPYFDFLLDRLEQEDPNIVKAFGRHVHWGYWQNPGSGNSHLDDFAAAAERLTQLVYTAANVHNGQKVLDAGCGFGGAVASLNEQFTGMELTGLNIDARQIERARQQVQTRPGNRVEFIHGNACELPFEDGSFDRVLAVECIFHFPYRKRFFEEVRRVLKPGGRLALSDFVPHPFLAPVARVIQSFDRPWFYGRVNSQYAIKGYRQLARSLGFPPPFEQDITVNTLPTYKFLQKLFKQEGSDFPTAKRETKNIALVSRFNLLKYMVLGFEKPLR